MKKREVLAGGNEDVTLTDILGSAENIPPEYPDTRAGRRAARREQSKYLSRRNSFVGNGFSGRGGGRFTSAPKPPTFRGPTTQLAGFWPFVAGSSRPAVGVPVGQDIQTGATVCCDPISWFRAGYCSSPSMFVMGLNGLGKSSFVARQLLGMSDRGAVPLVAGDVKGEYRKLVEALEKTLPSGEVVRGQVIAFGQGAVLNPLDPGSMLSAADRIGGDRGIQLRELAIQRAITNMGSLLRLVRKGPLKDFESALLSSAVRYLMLRRGDNAPTISDLDTLLENPTVEMMHAVLSADRNAYVTESRKLHQALRAVIEGSLGPTFNGQSTTPLRLDAPGISLDISAVERQRNDDLLAAVMLVSWSEGFGAIEAANALTDAGLVRQMEWVTIMDEMWRPLAIPGAGLVDQLNGITRLQRNDGASNIFVTHSMKDLNSLASAADNQKARGFVERSGILVTAGLTREDLDALSSVRKLSEVEKSAVQEWSTPSGGWQDKTIVLPDGTTRPAPPPGAGKILIKVGERAGVQTQVRLTSLELELHDTNERWVRSFEDAEAS